MSSKKQDNIVLGIVYGMIIFGFVQTEHKLWSIYEHDKSVLEQKQRGLSYGAAKNVEQNRVEEMRALRNPLGKFIMTVFE